MKLFSQEKFVNYFIAICIHKSLQFNSILLNLYPNIIEYIGLIKRNCISENVLKNLLKILNSSIYKIL